MYLEGRVSAIWQSDQLGLRFQSVNATHYSLSNQRSVADEASDLLHGECVFRRKVNGDSEDVERLVDDVERHSEHLERHYDIPAKSFSFRRKPRSTSSESRSRSVGITVHLP